MKVLKNIATIKTGSYLENAKKVKYVVERDDEKFQFVLTELCANGSINEEEKKRVIPFDLLDGLIRTRHFSVSNCARRISYGELEKIYEFDKRIPR